MLNNRKQLRALDAMGLWALVACFCLAWGDIHAAVRENDPDAIQEALEDGEDINSIGPGGQTPLMHGVLTGNARSAACTQSPSALDHLRCSSC